MLRVAGTVQAEKLSVRRTEELVREQLAEPRESQEATEKPREEPNSFDEYGEASRQIQDALTLPTRVRASRRGGRLEIRFRQKEELEALVALLTVNKVGKVESVDGVLGSEA